MPVFMPHWPKPLGKRPIEIDLKLERVQMVLNKLGHPQHYVPPVIHVAGTNGKGSTVAFMRAMLSASGYRTHVYTSPHLIYFNERIIIADNNCGTEITDNYLFQILEEVRLATGETKITLFEAATIAAILAFKQKPADFCLIETGMGGRLDATNVFPNVLLNIITSISFDHMQYLGNTLEHIAFEKAGIIKENVTTIISAQEQEARAALETIAIKEKSPVFRYSFEWLSKDIDNKLLFQAGSAEEEFKLPGLQGKHQIINAGNAIAALTLLKNKFHYNKISYEAINTGLEKVHWPARLQLLNNNKNNALIKRLQAECKDWQLLLDGAHNTGGALTIKEWLLKEKCYFIIGMTREKNTKEFLSCLKNNIQFLQAICVQGEPRSQTIQEILEAAAYSSIPASGAASIMAALLAILEINETVAKDENINKIIICGSLFLAKDVAYYEENYK